MSNTFYNVTYSFSEKTLARGTEVKQEFNSVASAFNSLETFYNSKFIPLDLFNKYHLGFKESAPTLDNSGATLLTGAEYFDAGYDCQGVWTGVKWTYSAKDAALYAANSLQSSLNSAASAVTAGSYVSTVQASAVLASQKADEAAASAVLSANAAAQNTAGLSTVLNTHIYDFAAHLTVDQNTLLDGITATATQINNTVSGLSSHLVDDTRHITVGQNNFLDGINVSYTQVNDAATGFPAHAVDMSKHLTTEQNTLLDGITATYSQINLVATSYPTHAASADLHLTPAQNTLLDGITASFSDINLLAGSSKGVALKSASNRASVVSFTTGGTLVAGATYAMNTSSGSITAIMPSISSSVVGDTIIILNSQDSWSATNTVSISAPTGVRIRVGNTITASGESLVCDTSNFAGLTLICNATNNLTFSFWSVI